MRRHVARALASLFLIGCAWAQAKPPDAKPASAASESVRLALADQGRMADLLEKYSYSRRIISESATMKDKVTGHYERVYSYAPCEGKQCITLVSVDNRPPKEKELKAHEKEVKKLWEQQAKKTAADKQKEDDEDLFLSKDFVAVFDFTDAGSDLYKGAAVQVVAFQAKDEKVQLADKDNKVLTKMAGRMWITEVDHQIVASEMHMVKPIKVWGGFAGAINNMTVHQEYFRQDGMYLPKRSAVEMELRIMFNKSKLRLTEEYFDFKAPAPAVAAR